MPRSKGSRRFLRSRIMPAQSLSDIPALTHVKSTRGFAFQDINEINHTSRLLAKAKKIKVKKKMIPIRMPTKALSAICRHQDKQAEFASS